MTHCSNNWECLQYNLNNNFPALVCTASVKVKRCRQIWQGSRVQNSLMMQSLLRCFIVSFLCVWYILLLFWCHSSKISSASPPPTHIERRKVQTTKFQISNYIIIPADKSCGLINYKVLLKITSLITLQMLLCFKVLSTVQIIFGEICHGVMRPTRQIIQCCYVFMF